MFGSFQPSDRLFETARRARGAGTPAEQAETRNARHNVRVLAEEAGCSDATCCSDADIGVAVVADPFIRHRSLYRPPHRLP